jgi:uncharacterized protein (DUF58 family)
MIQRLRDLNPSRLLARLLNRNLPPDRHISLQTAWPLFLLPWFLVLQLIDPSPLWMVLLVSALGFYTIGFLWVRAQANSFSLTRRRLGVMLVAGDSLREDFTLHNHSSLPVLWAVFEDFSYLPGYNPSQVVSCGGGDVAHWHREAICRQRGLFRLGPHRLQSGDPFGLFRLEILGDQQESLLVYPRVAHLPHLELPRGRSAGRQRRQRLLNGDLRAPVVRHYQPGDTLRYIHWPKTAHRGTLMVTELEEDSSGDLWIVLDLNQAVHQSRGEQSTLEYSVIMAASLAAELLGSSERRAVGLLAVGKDFSGERAAVEGATVEEVEDSAVILPPQRGQGQLWRILAALAPIQPGTLPVADLLQRHRQFLGKGNTVMLITPEVGENSPNWIAELLSLRRSGLQSSVMVVTPPGQAKSGQEEPAQVGSAKAETVQTESVQAEYVNGQSSVAAEQDALSDLLARQEFPVQFIQAGTPLRPVLTYRRRRTVLLTTPQGGAISREVEEEVG